MKHVIGKYFELVDDRKIMNINFEKGLIVRVGSIDKLGVVLYFKDRDDFTTYTKVSHKHFLRCFELYEPQDEPQKPAHYDTGIDTIAFLRANCPPEQVEGFLRGNAIKYLQRYASKGTPVEDLKKSRHYIDMLIEELEGRV